MFQFWGAFVSHPRAPIDEPLYLPVDKNSYMAALYPVVKQELNARDLVKVPDMESCVAMRDFLCEWCNYWAHFLPPFQTRSEREEQRTREDWE